MALTKLLILVLTCLTLSASKPQRTARFFLGPDCHRNLLIDILEKAEYLAESMTPQDTISEQDYERLLRMVMLLKPNNHSSNKLPIKKNYYVDIYEGTEEEEFGLQEFLSRRDD